MKDEKEVKITPDEKNVANSTPASETQTEKKWSGLEMTRLFTTPGVHPFNEIEWEYRNSSITGEDGKTVFEQKNVEVPKSWSMTAMNVVVSKYFHGLLGTPGRETSVKQLVERVCRTTTDWGIKGNYFKTKDDAETFYHELTYIMANQYASFNSPVWFNVGIEEKPQCSACFINSVEDTMDSILGLAKTEGMLFKWGSGTGSNLSTLRSSKEKLSGGGTASGPVSFMKGFDSFAGVIKSGGKTRRAAKMVILNVDHPDVMDFINSKADEEKKAWTLIEAGYEGGFNVPGGAYDSIQFQNANHSVRVTDEFMKAVLEDKEWQTHNVRDGKVAATYKARDILRAIAEGTYICGDPGMQWHTTVNDWHTCSNTAPINASNPCSEYMFLDDSACNLASLNLMKFRRPDGEFDIKAFQHAVSIVITAQEIFVNNASYPTSAIEKNSHEYRPLGLGYANLGALLMARGISYDSDEARAYCAAVTALMHGQAYLASAEISKNCGGPFRGFQKNREPMLRVIKKHQNAVNNINHDLVPGDFLKVAEKVWEDCYEVGSEYGYRNSQVTVLAPTGTIGFMMDCDTTGIEPDIALVKYKKLVGGGLIKIVNQTVPLALEKLGYNDKQIKAIIDYIEKNDTIEGAPELKPAHLPVFDCAFKPRNGVRSIQYMGHLKMMAAAQPFLSGAISKTCNVPENVTVEELMDAYIESWKLGLKAVAIYRDNSKRTQPLNTSLKGKEKVVETPRPVRRRLLDERVAVTHKFSIAGHEGYITIGMYEDGTPGEVFITMSKEGSTISGLMDSLATSVSLNLQYGVPLRVLVDKFTHMRFEPSGFTNNPDIPMAKSIIDYMFRWIAVKFLSAAEAGEYNSKTAAQLQLPVTDEKRESVPSGKFTPAAKEPPIQFANGVTENEQTTFRNQADAPSCHACGTIMVRSGSCYKCFNCGETSGCS